MRTRSSLAAVLTATALAACGGGGGGAAGGVGPPLPPPPGSASASGTVVDTASGAPLPGVGVVLVPFGGGAALGMPTVTGARGEFTAAAAAPGRYLLVIGSDSATDTRATFHLVVTLAAGANSLAAPVAQPFPSVQYPLAETSPGFRLAQLSADELGCIGGANAGRAQLGLRSLVPDELLLEDARAVTQEELAQSTDTPTPLFANPPNAQYIFTGLSAPMHTEQDFQQCAVWTGPPYSYVPGNPPYAQAADAAERWYGAAFSPAPAGDPHASYGAQLWEPDSRT